MASPSPETPSLALVSTPVRLGPGVEESLWRRLREAGLDEETVRRRDKAALIAYISKLEAELYEYQHNMGLLLLEKKDWATKYELLKASSDAYEMTYAHARAAEQTLLDDARKREESLKKALDIEKECVANMEKEMHEMMVETAERKVSYESKVAEANKLMETAQRKLEEADERLLDARSLKEDSLRTRDAALRSLRDIEAREDDLRRSRSSFDSEYESRMKEIRLQRKGIQDTEKYLKELEDKLLDKHALLNEREADIVDRLEKLKHDEERVKEETKLLEVQRKALLEEQRSLDLRNSANLAREEAITRRESLLDKRESDLLLLQENISMRQRDDIQRLDNEQMFLLEKRKIEFNNEMQRKQSAVEAELEEKKKSLLLRENNLHEKEIALSQDQQEFEVQRAKLVNREEEISRRLIKLQEDEEAFSSTRAALESKMQIEKEDIRSMWSELEKLKTAHEKEKLSLIEAQKKLEITEDERSQFLILESKLKEEIDNVRAQRKELLAEADRLQAEKEKFEIEWELIDEKKDDLLKEESRLAEERKSILERIKDEQERIIKEKEDLRIQYKSELESLAREHEEFVSSMHREQTSWLSKYQKERDDFKRDFDNQREELLMSIKKQQEEIKSCLLEKEKAFEQEKARELEYINSQKKMIASQLEYVATELQKLETERVEISKDREYKERELEEISCSILELTVQREKLQEQRKLLHEDRQSINVQMKQLSTLEEFNIDSEHNALSYRPSSRLVTDVSRATQSNIAVGDVKDLQPEASIPSRSPKNLMKKSVDATPAFSTPLSWARKCAQIIFRNSDKRSSLSPSSRSEQEFSHHHKYRINDHESLPVENALLQLDNGLSPSSTRTEILGKKRQSDYDVHLEPKHKYQRKNVGANGSNTCSTSPALKPCSDDVRSAAQCGAATVVEPADLLSVDASPKDNGAPNLDVQTNLDDEHFDNNNYADEIVEEGDKHD